MSLVSFHYSLLWEGDPCLDGPTPCSSLPCGGTSLHISLLLGGSRGSDGPGSPHSSSPQGPRLIPLFQSLSFRHFTRVKGLLPRPTHGLGHWHWGPTYSSRSPWYGCKGIYLTPCPSVDLAVHSPGLVNPLTLGVPFLGYGKKYLTHDLETGSDSQFLLFS